MDHAPRRHADRRGRCGRSPARVDSGVSLAQTNRQERICHPVVSAAGARVRRSLRWQWRSPKSFRRSSARRVVIWSKAIQTVVGFVVGVFVAASVGLMASPPDLAPAPSVPPVAVGDGRRARPAEHRIRTCDNTCSERHACAVADGRSDTSCRHEESSGIAARSCPRSRSRHPVRLRPRRLRRPRIVRPARRPTRRR